MAIGLYLSSTADGRLVTALRPEVETLGGVVLGEGVVRSLRGSVALDARINGLRGDFEVSIAGRLGDVRPIDRDSAPYRLYSSVKTSLPASLPEIPSFPCKALALARATIRARMLASLAASLTGSWPSHNRSGVEE